MTDPTIDDLLRDELFDWRRLAQRLHARYRTGTFATGLRFVNAIGVAAEQSNHHPDLRLGYGYVEIELLSHDVGRITTRDLALARTISQLAAEHAVQPDPTAVTQLELALDTGDHATIGPFWAAVLTGDPQALVGDEVRDRAGRVPNLWFQPCDGPGQPAPPQRFHLDVWVPHDVAADRIAAALAAGGTLVDDLQAPSFTVLADAQGNRACICTCLERAG